MANVSYSMEFFNQLSLVLNGNGSQSREQVQKVFDSLDGLQLRMAIRLCVRKRSQLADQISSLWSDIHAMDTQMRERLDDFSLIVDRDRYGFLDHFEVMIERSDLISRLDQMTEEIKAKMKAIENSRAMVFMLDELINCQDDSSLDL